MAMKKKIALLAMILCLAGTTTAFARGGYRGGYHYYDRGYSHGYYGGRHHDNGVGIAFGVMGGLLLGSALVHAAAPPPTVGYGYPYAAYPPAVVVRQPQICVEDRVVNGEWQVSQYDGRQVWVSYPYPLTQRVQVPCY
jgi:hypothetical protein